MNCSVCGQPLPDGAQFCPNCGAPVSAGVGTEERKMVTVLFADLVDSTGLAQRLDPERAREVLGHFFDAATEELLALRGRPEKFIGDAVMAVFGLPQVHEDDAVRAVRAGLAIRDRARRLSRSLGLVDPLDVHIGIESGEAATGVGPSGQLLVTGRVVNVAARLQAAALPGEVLAGETTHSLTESALSFRDWRTVDAKGFDDGLTAYPVEGLTTRSVRRTIPFVGRASELAILRECVGRVTSTGRPLLFTVVGESGIGKSRLADELVAGLDPAITVLTGRGQPYTDTATFATAEAMVRDLASIEDTDPVEKARQRLAETVDRWCAPDDVERTGERLEMLLGLTRRRRRDEYAFVDDVHAGFLALIEGVARDAPVVVVFEDVQSLPAPMLDLIERLAARARHGPRQALILALARPALLDERPGWASSATNAVMMRLEPLPSEEAIDLVRQAGGGQIDESQATEIAARTGGNPFFIVETTGMCLPLEEGSPSAPRPSLPPTVQAVVSARLDALAPELRDLARRGSVFLHSFDLAELAVVGDAAVQELHRLEEAEILVRDEGSTPRWRFRHATLREVAYGSLPKRERMRMHELVADNLVASGHPSWAADHLERAALASLDLDPDDRRLPERAAGALVEAGDRSRRRIESRPAVDLYERALAVSGPEERWGVREARALAGIGEARYWLSDYPAATEALERAVTLGTEHGDQFALALALRFLGDIAINVEGDVDKAERLLEQSLEAAEALGEPFAIARSLLFAGWVPWTRDRYDAAEALWRRALTLAEENDDGWARVRALTSLSINRTDMDDPEEALRLIDQASALAEERGDQFSIAVTTVQRSRVFGELGRLEEALPGFDRGIAIFEDLGARWELADATAERGIVRGELGRLDEAEGDLRFAIRLSEELGELQLASWTWRALALVAERRGDHAEAEERFRRAKEARARRGL